MPGIDDNQSRDIAQQMERDNPQWIVIFGVYTKEFVGFPQFSAPPGTVVAACYPAAMSDRMREAERALQPATRRSAP